MKAVISLAFFALLGASSVYSEELRGGVAAKNAHVKVSDGFLPSTTNESIDEEDEGMIFPEDMGEEGEDEEGRRCRYPRGKETAVGCGGNWEKYYCKTKTGNCPKKMGVQRGWCTQKRFRTKAGKAIGGKKPCTDVCTCDGVSWCEENMRSNGINIASHGKCSTNEEDFDSGDKYYDDDEDSEDEDSEDEDSEDENSEDEDDGEDNKDAEKDEIGSIDEQ